MARSAETWWHPVEEPKLKNPSLGTGSNAIAGTLATVDVCGRIGGRLFVPDPRYAGGWQYGAATAQWTSVRLSLQWRYWGVVLMALVGGIKKALTKA